MDVNIRTLAAAASISLLVAGCGPDVAADRRSRPASARENEGSRDRGWQRYEAVDGSLSLRAPRSWTVRFGGVSGPDSPSVVLGAANRPFPNGGACAPSRAAHAVPDHGVFLFAFEYSSRVRHFPPRPQHFSLGPLDGPYECIGTKTHLILFEDSGRFLQIHVIFGDKAGKHIRQRTLKVLDSLRVEEA